MSYIKKISGFILSFLLIYLSLILGRFISDLLPFSFPGSIIGLIVLFLLLEFKVMKLEWILPAGNLLLKHMAFIFIPAAVGMVAYLNEVYDSALVIIINVLSGVALIILVVGRLFQHISETPEERAHRKETYRRAKQIKKFKH
jgi:holin-like protein